MELCNCANILRRKAEFDKAEAIYEQIFQDDEMEAEKLEHMLGGSQEQCMEQIEVIHNLLADRNRRCKALKSKV